MWCRGYYVFTAIEALYHNASTALRLNFYFPRQCLSVKGQEDNLFAIAIANRGSRYENSLRLRARLVVFVRQKFDCGVHVWPQVGIRIQNLHLHLHGRLRPVGLRRDFRDDSIPLEVRVRVHGDYTLLPGTEPGEIVLRDV